MKTNTIQNKQNIACFFDFDSTLVRIETLDFLIENISQQKINIADITSSAMNGNSSFKDSLDFRIKNSKINKNHIQILASTIQNYITQNAKQNIAFLQQYCDIYIISGGFLEIIHPFADFINIPRQNCFANTFLFDESNNVCGFDELNPLSNNGGKAKIIQQVQNSSSTKQYKTIFMIGDGYTDFEVTKTISDIIFCGFGEHVVRQNVLQNAKNFFYNFNDLCNYIKTFLHS